jgi:uncharacterized protein (DUF488 family)
MIYTIGHSKHPAERFIELLRQHDIGALADVRSTERVMAGSREHRIALMCAERDPLHCRRALLISPALERAGVPVSHILADGSLETHADLMKRVKPDPQEAFPFGC